MRGKKVFAVLLCFLLLCSFSGVEVLAAEELPESGGVEDQAVTEENAHSLFSVAETKNVVQVTLGDTDNASYKDLWALFADESISGDVVVKLLSDHTTPASKEEKVLEVPKRFTSLTFEADNAVVLQFGDASGSTESRALFANGKSITVGEKVTLKKDNSDVYIFGGGFGKPASGNPVILIDGKINGSIFGGGYNSELKGSSRIIVNGSARNVYGGGWAYARFNDYASAPVYKTASITGNADLAISEKGTVTSITGGGLATVSNSDALNNAIVFYVTADVGGSVRLVIDGKADKITGGGSAGDDDTSSNAAYAAAADISKNVSISFGSESRTASLASMDKMELYGGGKAVTGANISVGKREARADVGGDVSISADKDRNAATGQPDSTSFSRFVGGGFAKGPESVANIKGNTYVISARPAWESEMGIVGGGWAFYGGTANVIGTANITIKGIEGQYSMYENANGVIGGGFAGWEKSYFTGRTIDQISTANVGSTKITITDSACLTSGSFRYVSIVGGGLAYGDSRITGNSDYDKMPVMADVLGNTEIIIENAGSIEQSIYGGGLAYQRGSAVVHGDTSVIVKDGCETQSLIGGGYTAGNANVENAIKDATIRGNTNISIGNDVSGEGNFVGGGNSENDGHADVDGNIATAIGGNFTWEGWFYGSGAAWGAKGSTITKGSIVTDIGESCSISGQFIGGGGAEADQADASVIGDITTNIRNDFSCEYFTAAGRIIDGSNAAAVAGTTASSATVSTTFKGDGSSKASFADFAVGGGRVYCEDSDVTVYGDTELIFDGTSPDQDLCGGSYAASAATAEITGTAATVLKNTNDFAESIYGGGFAEVADGNADTGSVFINTENGAVDSIYGAGYYKKSGISANVDKVKINLKNAVVKGEVCASGSGAAKIGQAEVNLIGKTTIAQINKTADAGSLSGLVVNVGDGMTETHAAVSDFIRDDAIDLIHIYDLAELIHQKRDDNTGKLLRNVKEIQINDGGKIDFANCDEEIAGDLIGGGTIRLKAGRCFTAGGSVTGKTILEIDGIPEAGQIYVKEKTQGNGELSYLADGMALIKTAKEGGSEWIIGRSETITVTAGEHGAITPSGQIGVLPGHNQTFAFNADPGYKVEKVIVDGKEVEDFDKLGGKYTFENVTESHSLTVTFASMNSEDVKDAIENLAPSETVTEEEYKKNLLDAKIAYESLPEEEKKNFAEDVEKKLNEELSKLKEIDISLKADGEVESKVQAENLNAMTNLLTKTEAEQLLSGKISKISLQLVVTQAGSETIDQKESDYTVGKQMDISVIKIIDNKGGEKVSKIKQPIRLIFTIPLEMQGKNREYVLLHKHGGKVEILKDLDQNENTITVESDEFSPFAIAYKEMGSSVPPYGTTTYKIDAKAGAGGSITPTGTIYVKAGKDANFIIAADTGYAIQDVLIDGKSVGKANAYTFSPVYGHHTIEAVFEKEMSFLEEISIKLQTKLKENGHIKLQWKAVKGKLDAVEGYEVFRSLKKNSGYGKKPFFLTKHRYYVNSKSLKKGNRYYYKVRGYVTMDGKRYYTKWSSKAWRLIK